MGLQIITSSKHTRYPVMYFTQALGSVDALGETQAQCPRGGVSGWGHRGAGGCCPWCRYPGAGSPRPEVPVHWLACQLWKLLPSIEGMVVIPARKPSAGVQPAAGAQVPLQSQPRCRPPWLCGTARPEVLQSHRNTGISKRAPICSLITIPLHALCPQRSPPGCRFNCPVTAMGWVSHIFFFPKASEPGWCVHQQSPWAGASSGSHCRQKRSVPSAPSSLFAEHGYLLFATFRNEIAPCTNNHRETFLSSSLVPSALRPPECELVS